MTRSTRSNGELESGQGGHAEDAGRGLPSRRSGGAVATGPKTAREALEAVEEVVGMVRIAADGEPLHATCSTMALLGRYRSHGIELAARPPMWLVLEDPCGAPGAAIAACVGLWPTAPLPSRRYLGERRGPASEPGAGRCCELGLFTSVGSSGAIVRLMRAVPFLLAELGFAQVLCTATERERRVLSAASWELGDAVAASMERVPGAELPLWGRFFEAAPQTGWSSVEAALVAQVRWFARNLGLMLTRA